MAKKKSPKKMSKKSAAKSASRHPKINQELETEPILIKEAFKREVVISPKSVEKPQKSIESIISGVFVTIAVVESNIEALRVCMSSVPDFDPKIFFQYLTGNSKKFTASVLEKMLKANNITRRSNDRSLT